MVAQEKISDGLPRGPPAAFSGPLREGVRTGPRPPARTGPQPPARTGRAAFRPLPSPTAVADTEATTSGIPPEPDAAAKLGYLRALTGIDPDIVHGKEDKAVDRGRNQYQTIRNFPKDKPKQAEMAEMRFTSPSHPDGFGKVKAAQIVEAVHTNLCPEF
ncbi:hypothetical protein [Streptomyces decoyicus]